MAADILIAIALVTGAVLIVNQLARMYRNATLQRSIREAIQRDSAALPDLVARIDESGPTGTAGDERAGLVLIALGAALALFAVIAAPDEEGLRNMAGLALFPTFVGIVLLGRALWVRKHGEGR